MFAFERWILLVLQLGQFGHMGQTVRKFFLAKLYRIWSRTVFFVFSALLKLSFICWYNSSISKARPHFPCFASASFSSCAARIIFN
ncbi:MAG: hypothetical protein IPG92_01055 [Flavobacteriales bacterium]|nr:hypothetical protein [Flavobacteriales bacterium]